MSYRIAAMLCCAVAVATSTANAQSPQPHPADPKASVPAVKYDSAFTGYAPWRDEKQRPWRESNEEVHRAGGHLGIFGGAGAHAGHGTAAKPAAAPPVGSKKQ